jgi:two-component system alkaline phosphatase synthesis response regulator PhoP
MERPRILIVEDHSTMREAMRLVLEEGGYRIAEAADGLGAMDMVRDDPPDLIFLDLHIPGMSGADILQAIRSDPAIAGTRVIVVTAEGEEGRERAIALGADAYFTKPFSPAALLTRTAQVLGRFVEEA